MRMLLRASRKVQIAGELFHFFGHNRWWILPIIIIVVTLGGLLVVAETTGLAPFIYTMF